MSMHNEETIVEVIPGWYLVTGEWNGNMWGISTGNHPAFMFKDIPPIDPTHGMADDELNGMSEDAYADYCNGFLKYLEKFTEELVCSPELGYSLVKGGLEAGYNIEQHGTNFCMWFLNRIAWFFKVVNESKEAQ